MLPQVATHILHHTSRAAAAVHNQTSQAIRNAWQYQQATPSTASATGSGGISGWGGLGSSSGWGGSTGPGGAKYNAGSRFYSGYTGPGRSITQANHSSTQTDDNEERTLYPVRVQAAPVGGGRKRPRSNSLSFPAQGRIDRGEGLGVLKVVQMRARHAFATNPTVANAATIESLDSLEPHERSVLVRRNSTSTHSVASSDIKLDPLPPLPQQPPTPSSTGVEVEGISSSSEAAFESESLSSAPTSALSSENNLADVESDLEPSPATDADDKEAYDRLYFAAASRNYDEVVSEVQKYRARAVVTVPCYNMALHALNSCRGVGQPITLLLELYNEMLARSLLPNLRTYKILISACCSRDIECQRVIYTLDNRISRRSYTVGYDMAINETDEYRVSRLRAENNFTSALTLFQAATSAKHAYLGLNVYNPLLRSCAHHNNVAAAIRVFSHLEQHSRKGPSPSSFAHLVAAYGNVADLGGAREVFEEFKYASSHGRINWDRLEDDLEIDWVKDVNLSVQSASQRHKIARGVQIMVWNKMIEACFKCGEPATALGLLESMLDTPAGEKFKESDVPLPNSVTYTSIITGFCETGDWKSALVWFDRLLAREKAAQNPYDPLPSPPRPDQLAWIIMLDSLARAGAIDELNRIFTTLTQIAAEDDIHIRTVDRYSVFRANVLAMREPGVDPTRSNALFDFILKKVIVFTNPEGSMALTTAAARKMLVESLELLTERGQRETALDIVEKYASNEKTIVREAENAGIVTTAQVVYQSKGLRNMVQRASRILLWMDRHQDPSSPPPVKFALRVAALCEQAYLKPQAAVAPWYIHSYTESKKAGGPLELSEDEWVLLLKAFLSIELPPIDSEEAEAPSENVPSPPGYSYPGLHSLLLDMKDASNIQFWALLSPLRNKLSKALVNTHGLEKAARLISELGPEFSVLTLPGWGNSTRGPGHHQGESIPAVPASAPPNMHIDLYHSRFVDEWYPANPSVSPLVSYQRFKSGVDRGIYPSPETIGRLISGIGRLGEVDKVRTLYDAAQLTLSALENQKKWQSAGWFVVEDQMIIAFAHAGEYEAANVHRRRIIEQGGTPSADAYGALISAVKDTTDDTSNALSLWEEAVAREVRANTYLYNTIISKLSKARKADHALIIFRKMKSEGIKPSSITFGALISACCRVGDAQSAEHLFHEMTTAFNFKPRVPPYNTMIQLYTLTKPDRERVLYYYNALLAARIKPTAHTYRLLLEAYGTIQPVDLKSMEDIFQRITESREVEINGTHWGALINAYGCADKDLDRAIATFESISIHPSTARSSTPMPDAIAYEALFAVFSHHRRVDLIREYSQRLHKSNVHPTAYVSNATIKGFAAAGDLATAREIFESMQDPPIGVAAPHNHAPHEHQNMGYVPPQAPVYREPSTWETMIRAELGVSERERAMELIKRMEARQYPPAVLQRVRDIMYADGFYENVTPSVSSAVDQS